MRSRSLNGAECNAAAAAMQDAAMRGNGEDGSVNGDTDTLPAAASSSPMDSMEPMDLEQAAELLREGSSTARDRRLRLQRLFRWPFFVLEVLLRLLRASVQQGRGHERISH